MNFRVDCTDLGWVLIGPAFCSEPQWDRRVLRELADFLNCWRLLLAPIDQHRQLTPRLLQLARIAAHAYVY